MADKILKETEPFEPEKKLVAQCYDGASLMSGHKSGVQKRIRDQVPMSLYIHCMAHEVCFKRYIALH